MNAILLVRHGVAVRRHEWDGPDRYRPLSPRGHKQAAALVGALSPFRPVRVLSSPATRCGETVAPLAAALGLDVEEVEDLYEGHGTDALDLLLSRGTWHETPRSTGQNDAVVACSHGDVLPELLLELARERGLRGDVPYDPPFAKGAAWVVTGEYVRYLGPPA